MRSAAVFPFVAVPGMDLAKRALLLVSIEPALKGVLLATGRGTGKSLLARSVRSLFPALPWVELPLGTAEDRLLGGLDLERTLAAGRPQIAAGLLGRAHGGILHVDGINLLDRRLARHLAAAVNRGIVRVERDGLSTQYASDFVLVGTYDPEEGAVSASLADSVAIHVMDHGVLSKEHRVELLRGVAAFDRDPVDLASRHAEATSLLRRRIDEARSRLAAVDASVSDRRRLSQAALRLGVEGNRADIFALAVARAHAAFMKRRSVDEEDLRAAVRLVLLPRAAGGSVSGAAASRALSPERSQAATERPGTADSSERLRRPAPLTGEPSTGTAGRAALDDLVMAALDCAVPEDVRRLPPGDSSSNDRHTGRNSDSERRDWNRGRCVRAVAARPEANKVALAATLLAAAPHQKRRRQSAPESPVIRVEASDLRFKQFRQNASIRILFAVDASGSMAMNRIQQAKGAAVRLLDGAYRDRDEIALIGFRGDRAELLLPPSRSIELAKRALDALPVGGGTPLAAALETALHLTRCARPSDARDTLLVILTDGKANVPRRPHAGLERRDAIWRDVE